MSENQQDQGINEGYDVCCRCHIIAQRGEPLYLLTVCVPCWDEVAARTKDAKTKQKQRLESKVNQVQLQAAGSDHAQDVQLPVGVPDQTQPLAPPTAVPNEAEDVHPTAAVSEQADDVQPPPVAGPVLGSEIVEPVAAAANDNQVQDEDESYQGPVGSSSPRLDLDLSTARLHVRIPMPVIPAIQPTTPKKKTKVPSVRVKKDGTPAKRPPGRPPGSGKKQSERQPTDVGAEEKTRSAEESKTEVQIEVAALEVPVNPPVVSSAPSDQTLAFAKDTKEQTSATNTKQEAQEENNGDEIEQVEKQLNEEKVVPEVQTGFGEPEVTGNDKTTPANYEPCENEEHATERSNENPPPDEKKKDVQVESNDGATCTNQNPETLTEQNKSCSGRSTPEMVEATSQVDKPGFSNEADPEEKEKREEPEEVTREAEISNEKQKRVPGAEANESLEEFNLIQGSEVSSPPPQRIAPAEEKLPVTEQDIFSQLQQPSSSHRAASSWKVKKSRKKKSRDDESPSEPKRKRAKMKSRKEPGKKKKKNKRRKSNPLASQGDIPKLAPVNTESKRAKRKRFNPEADAKHVSGDERLSGTNGKLTGQDAELPLTMAGGAGPGLNAEPIGPDVDTNQGKRSTLETCAEKSVGSGSDPYDGDTIDDEELMESQRADDEKIETDKEEHQPDELHSVKEDEENEIPDEDSQGANKKQMKNHGADKEKMEIDEDEKQLDKGCKVQEHEGKMEKEEMVEDKEKMKISFPEEQQPNKEGSDQENKGKMEKEGMDEDKKKIETNCPEEQQPDKVGFVQDAFCYFCFDDADAHVNLGMLGPLCSQMSSNKKPCDDEDALSDSLFGIQLSSKKPCCIICQGEVSETEKMFLYPVCCLCELYIRAMVAKRKRHMYQ